jgi:hypothetical protein
MKYLAQKPKTQNHSRPRKRTLINQYRPIEKKRKSMGKDKMDKDIDCNLDMEVDEKIECYFPGGKSDG